MKPKEFYKDTYGEDPPKTFDKMAAILLFDFAEAYHASQTEMPSEDEIKKQAIKFAVYMKTEILMLSDKKDFQDGEIFMMSGSNPN
jgi:hypothetical protein